MAQEPIRLNKYIAASGLCSRRGADDLIREGKVMINGKLVQDLGCKVYPYDAVKVDHQLIKVDKTFDYILFYKPPGYVTTCRDEKNRKTIYHLLPNTLKHLKPVGRLDKDTSGLILLTNDGDFIYRLSHPKFHMPKVYEVDVEGIYQNSFKELFETGLEIEPGKIARADFKLLQHHAKVFQTELTLYQGYNRQIRKMFEKVHCRVIYLKRVRVGFLSLKGLQRGEYRFLTQKEIETLKHHKTER